ncbi:glycosyltransferase family 9 protein [Salinimicrobium sp. CDJ15-81-2]|nr:glycosyltransferase family 9 protein [Salinimicrobium nanhaiense]
MKILIIQQKMIGDVLTSSILFRAIKKQFPKAVLHYLIHKHTLPVVKNNPFIDHFLQFDPEEDSKPLAILRWRRELKAQQYDAVIDVYSKVGTAILAVLTKAPIRISYDKWYTRKFYTRTFKPKKKSKTNAGLAVENRMLLLQGIGQNFPVEMKPEIYLTSEEKEKAKQRLLADGIALEKPLIMCGILGSSETKTYPLPYMAQVLDFIVEKTGAQLVFNYIPRQVEAAGTLYDLCKPETQKQIFFDIFGTSLREFMAITSFCNALIGNEGGAVNMAKALDVPTFAIFSPQIKKGNWGIYEDGKRHISVHISDFRPEVKLLPRKQIRKKSAAFYELLRPSLIFAKLDLFLAEVANPGEPEPS